MIEQLLNENIKFSDRSKNESYRILREQKVRDYKITEKNDKVYGELVISEAHHDTDLLTITKSLNTGRVSLVVYVYDNMGDSILAYRGTTINGFINSFYKSKTYKYDPNYEWSYIKTNGVKYFEHYSEDELFDGWLDKANELYEKIKNYEFSNAVKESTKSKRKNSKRVKESTNLKEFTNSSEYNDWTKEIKDMYSVLLIINFEGGDSSYDLERYVKKYQPDAKDMDDLTDDTIYKVYNDLRNKYSGEVTKYDDSEPDYVALKAFKNAFKKLNKESKSKSNKRVKESVNKNFEQKASELAHLITNNITDSWLDDDTYNVMSSITREQFYNRLEKLGFKRTTSPTEDSYYLQGSGLCVEYYDSSDYDPESTETGFIIYPYES